MNTKRSDMDNMNSIVDTMSESRAESLAIMAMDTLDRVPEEMHASIKLAFSIGWWKDVIKLYCKARSGE